MVEQSMSVCGEPTSLQTMICFLYHMSELSILKKDCGS